MDPTVWITNAANFVLGALVPLGLLVLVSGIAMWGAAKPLDSPKLSSTGTKAFFGGAAMSVAPALIGAGQFLARRVTGGA